MSTPTCDAMLVYIRRTWSASYLPQRAFMPAIIIDAPNCRRGCFEPLKCFLATTPLPRGRSSMLGLIRTLERVLMKVGEGVFPGYSSRATLRLSETGGSFSKIFSQNLETENWGKERAWGTSLNGGGSFRKLDLPGGVHPPLVRLGG